MNKDLLNKLRGDAIAYRPSFAKVIISTKTVKRIVNKVEKLVDYEERFGTAGAVYLQQLLYWCDKGTREDGFIYKSKDEIYDETGVTPREQDRIRLILVGLGCIVTETHRANGSPTIHYKINLEKVAELFLTSEGYTRTNHSNQRSVSPLPTVSLETHQRYETITESTSEITTESNILATTPSVAVKSNKVITLVNESADINSMVIYFYKTLCPAVSPIFSPTNRKAFDNLITVYGLKDIRDNIDKAKKLIGVDYAPQISNISVFATKYETIKSFKPKARFEMQPMIRL